MPSSKREAEDMRALCAHLSPDDGVAPREDKRRDAAGTEKTDRKLQQLCKQVSNGLQLVLPSVPSLVDAGVSSVTPAPNAGRLRVVVAVPDTCDPRQVAAELEHCRGYLRREIAQVVSRRRVPELVFSIIAEDTGNE